MNLFSCRASDPVRLGGRAISLDVGTMSQVSTRDGERVVIGFRPEAIRAGEGPLTAQIRTIEDLGSEVFVHVAFDHEGETVSAVSKMPAPFAGRTGDPIGVLLAGTVHLFDPTGQRLATTNARFRP